jgi:HK97 family phage major capsid protein
VDAKKKMSTASITTDRLLYRVAEVDRTALTRGKRSVSVAFSSETPVLRRDDNGKPFYEVLDHDPENVDLSLLQNHGAFLDEHDWGRQVGSVDRAWLDESDRRGRAELVFADTALGRERFTLMSEGHRPDISVGYKLMQKLGEDRGSDGIPVRRFAWKAHEISSTAVGADHFATGVGRSYQSPQTRTIMTTETLSQNDIQLSAFADEFCKDRPDLESEIRALKIRAISEDTNKRDFAKQVHQLFERKPAPRHFKPVHDRELGMSRAEINQFSFSRAILSAVENGGVIGGYEKEVSQEVERKTGQRSEGIFIPGDIQLGGSRRDFLQRDMFTGDFSAGGAVVPTIFATPPIELLRNKVVCSRLGATVLAGMTGDFTMPRQESATVASAVPEIGQINNTDIGLGQVRMTPHRVGVQCIYSRQLVIQSAPDVEALIRTDLFSVMAIKHDELLLNGSGANDEPLGLMNQIGIGSFVFGGTPTYAQIVNFESVLGKYNADLGKMGYMTTPVAKGRLKGIAVALLGASTVSARSLWEAGNFADEPSDGIVNGYRAAASNQVPGDRLVFGNWLDLVYAQWSGFELITDVFTRAGKGEIIVTLNSWMDSAVRHPQSFAVSADSANQ